MIDISKYDLEEIADIADKKGYGEVIRILTATKNNFDTVRRLTDSLFHNGELKGTIGGMEKSISLLKELKEKIKEKEEGE